MKESRCEGTKRSKFLVFLVFSLLVFLSKIQTKIPLSVLLFFTNLAPVSPSVFTSPSVSIFRFFSSAFPSLHRVSNLAIYRHCKVIVATVSFLSFPFFFAVAGCGWLAGSWSAAAGMRCMLLGGVIAIWSLNL